MATVQLPAQDWVHTGTNLGNDRIRIAAADFKPVGEDPQTPALKAAFDATLYSDLANAGIFDLVSKSMEPQATPGSPQEISLPQWTAAPANAAMVAFGALSATNGRLIVYGWLFDTHNTVNPQVLGKQYNEVASQDMARTVAHRFADEIIYRLGGGINGIAETKIYFVSSRTGTKEIWAMDYDGQNQHQVTHLGSISISPRISPDNSRIAFASLGRMGWSIRMY
jgi:TolB protein